MENQLWNLFRETGDPMGYLLLKAEEKSRKTGSREKPDGKKNAPPPNTPAASV